MHNTINSEDIVYSLQKYKVVKDKMYLMVKEFKFKSKPSREVFNEMYDHLIQAKQNLSYKDKQQLKENIRMFLNNPEQMKDMDSDFKEMYNLYKKIGFTVEKPNSGRAYRNNKIVDMTLEVMTHETTVDKMLNPGGFEQQKKMAYLVEAYRRTGKSWEELFTMDTDDLKKLSYTDKNLTFIDTHIDFYKQNAAAASLIGIFAVANIAHIILQNNRYLFV